MAYALVVDDDEINQEILSKMLASLGYRAELFSQAQKALEHCKNFMPRFILLDFHMKEMDGLSFLKALRALDPKSRVPVIMCTAEDKEEYFKELREAGISGYLLKPFTEDALLKQLKELGLHPPGTKNRHAH